VNLTWTAARAGGIVAWALAAASILWGLAISTRATGPRPGRPWLYDLHRFLGGLAVVFTAVHVGAVLLDGFTPFGLADVLVPFAASWHPTAVAWGIVAFYLLLAVELTSLIRTRIPARLWRGVHLASFVLFVTSTIHALTAGTDRGSTLLVAPMVATVAAVGVLTTIRLGSVLDRRLTPVTTAPARPARVSLRVSEAAASVGSTRGSGPRTTRPLPPPPPP
jgi:predicted ferric reductase